jgi:hypothetical protein
MPKLSRLAEKKIRTNRSGPGHSISGPFDNRTQIVSAEWPFEYRTVRYSDGYWKKINKDWKIKINETIKNVEKIPLVVDGWVVFIVIICIAYSKGHSKISILWVTLEIWTLNYCLELEWFGPQHLNWTKTNAKTKEIQTDLSGLSSHSLKTWPKY